MFDQRSANPVEEAFETQPDFPKTRISLRPVRTDERLARPDFDVGTIGIIEGDMP